MSRFAIISVALLLATYSVHVHGAEPVTLENVAAPGPNNLQEPVAKEFSLDRAVHFLDSAALQWQSQRQCFTCHTNLAYLYARPSISSDAPAHKSVRSFADKLVNERWKEKGPRWDAEVVAIAAALSFNDAATTGQLHATTKTALDRMWTIQKEDGGWDWLKCDWPPFEHDDHYGVTLAAIAVGAAPGEYAQSERGKKGLAGIRKYLTNNPPENLHHRAMTLWASTYIEDLVTNQQKETWVDELRKLQNSDGGWTVATLGNWNRADGSKQDTTTSDGYGTGFVLYVLRQAGVAKSDVQIQRGVQWLKTNQRESGRWISRSLFKDNKHFLSHAGSAFAVMALAECDEVSASSQKVAQK